MDIQTALTNVVHNFSVMNAILLLLLIAQTVMSETDSIKANTWYGLVRTLIMTFVEQFKPQPQAVETPAVTTTDTTPKA
jgi:hypothetical protein